MLIYLWKIFFHPSLLIFFFWPNYCLAETFFPKKNSHVKKNQEHDATWTFHYYVIAIFPKLGPPFLVHTCSILVAPSPLWKVQNLISTPYNNHHHHPTTTTITTSTFTLTPHKNRKFCDFIVLLPNVTAPVKYHKRFFAERSPRSPKYIWY